MRAMHVRSSLAVALVLAASACSKPEPPKEEPKGRINEESIGKAKAAIKAPLPVADAKKAIVAVLGEPTAKDGDNLIWAGVDGSHCIELKLVVQEGEAKGTTSTKVYKALDQYKDCVARAGK